jgi:Flp pilus assembly pilin Flp
MALPTAAPGSRVRERLSFLKFSGRLEEIMQMSLTAVERFQNRGNWVSCGAVPCLSKDEEGQDLLEYAVLCALIAIFAIGAVQTLGNTINVVFWSAIAAASV